MSHREMSKLLCCYRVQLRLVGKDLQSVIPSLLSEFGIKRWQVELKAKGVCDSKVLMILELIWANLMLKKPKALDQDNEAKKLGARVRRFELLKGFYELKIQV